MRTVNTEKFQPKTDCWAFENNKCNILTECLCKKKKCSHYQTPGQLKNNLDNCAERLERLGIPSKKGQKNNRVSGN